MAQVLTKAPKIENGSAAPELHLHNYEPSALGLKEVLVRFLAAPINPLDVLVLADVYPVKPQHHYSGEPIPGYDGVAEIVDCGEDVNELAKGDLVIPSKFGMGTWRTHAVLDVQWLQKVSRPTDMAFAALLRISIAPAYCLVEDMSTLKPGDWIIQNAATSVVAQMVVQFARQLTLRGFRGSAQVALRSAEEQRDLFNWFISIFNSGELVLPTLGLDKVVWNLDGKGENEERLLTAVRRAQQGNLGQRKQLIIFN